MAPATVMKLQPFTTRAALQQQRTLEKELEEVTVITAQKKNSTATHLHYNAQQYLIMYYKILDDKLHGRENTYNPQALLRILQPVLTSSEYTSLNILRQNIELYLATPVQRSKKKKGCA